MKIKFTEIGGACPFRSFGEVNELPFYFRLRYSKWELWVARRDRDPVRPGSDDMVLGLAGDWDDFDLTGDIEIKVGMEFIISRLEENRVVLERLK